MRYPIGLTLVAAFFMLALAIIVGTVIVDPPRPLLVRAEFLLETITPNADGIEDITEFSYEVTKNVFVSLSFEAEDGTVFAFRERERRAPGEYRVRFSGVVDGYTYPDEDLAGEVLRRLIPNGTYTWRFIVAAQDGSETVERSGTFIVEDADNPLPLMAEFSVGPSIFTPNQDGVGDRVMVNIYLTKDADLNVYLLDEQDRKIPLQRREEGRELGQMGRQDFNYDGGIDQGIDPPPNGTYRVIAEAQDAVGQVTQRETILTIEDGGLPRAEIVAQPVGPTVTFEVQPYEDRLYSTIGQDRELILGDLVELPLDSESLDLNPITMPLGDMLVFKLTIENYGTAPIRTSGPPPGTVYQQTQIASSLGQMESSGAWRVGIECETALSNYPWRWAIGTEEDLVQKVDPTNGNVYYYLPPGGRSVVWGAVRMTELVETYNPQDCWAGLIHEDVRVTLQNSNVGRRPIRLADMSAED